MTAVAISETAMCECGHLGRFHRDGSCHVASGCDCNGFVEHRAALRFPITGKPIAKTEAQMEDEERQARLAATVTVRCADCLWQQTGPQAEARVAWGEHRRDEHDDQAALAGVLRSLERAANGPRRTTGGRMALTLGNNNLEQNIAKTRAAGGGHGVRPDRRQNVARTCEEVPGCTNPTISDRGRYARVCAEHKDMVTARYAANGGGGVIKKITDANTTGLADRDDPGVARAAVAAAETGSTDTRGAAVGVASTTLEADGQPADAPPRPRADGPARSRPPGRLPGEKGRRRRGRPSAPQSARSTDRRCDPPADRAREAGWPSRPEPKPVSVTRAELAFRPELLHSLTDGVEVRFHPSMPEHAQRLMGALGVKVIFDENAPRRTRWDKDGRPHAQ